MIRIDAASTRLTPREQYGLDVLVDLSRALVVASSDATHADVAQAAVSLRTRPAPGGSLGYHALLAGGIEATDGAVTVSQALLAAVTDVAGAAIEQKSSVRDRYDRVPSSENPLVATGGERSPLVSRAAFDLRTAIIRAGGTRPLRWIAPWPGGHRWCAAFTHDVDVVSSWPLFSAFRLVELVRKRHRALARAVCAAAAGSAFGDPVGAGVLGVLETEHRAGIGSTWFLLCGTPTVGTWRRGDLTYRPESRGVRRIVQAIREAGHEIALHGSFATGDSAVIMQAQRHRLERVADTLVSGVRQHFLRMRPGPTQMEMARCEFTYDATYGFSDRNGFRLGVADSVLSWDEAGQHPLPLDEVPLTWMDRAQSKYQGNEDPQSWVDDALDLADEARRVSGLWVGLWHPNLTPALGYPKAPDAYTRLVAEVMRREPFVAPLNRIVAWRRLRRSLCARLQPDGALMFEGPAVREFDVVIEDSQDRTVTTLARTDR